MLKAKVNIQVLKVDRRLISLFKHFFRGKEIKTSEMSIFVKNFGPYSKLRTANWPIAWRKQTQPYNKGLITSTQNIIFRYNSVCSFFNAMTHPPHPLCDNLERWLLVGATGTGSVIRSPPSPRVVQYTRNLTVQIIHITICTDRMDWKMAYSS